jgi:hypothetical protein
MMLAANPFYFSEVLMVVNLPLSAVPTPLTDATITMLMPIAIRAYSIAVAPHSSLQKFFNNRRMKKAPVEADGILPRLFGNETLDWND